MFIHLASPSRRLLVDWWCHDLKFLDNLWWWEFYQTCFECVNKEPNSSVFWVKNTSLRDWKNTWGKIDFVLSLTSLWYPRHLWGNVQVCFWLQAQGDWLSGTRYLFVTDWLSGTRYFSVIFLKSEEMFWSSPPIPLWDSIVQRHAEQLPMWPFLSTLLGYARTVGFTAFINVFLIQCYTYMARDYRKTASRKLSAGTEPAVVIYYYCFFFNLFFPEVGQSIAGKHLPPLRCDPWRSWSLGSTKGQFSYTDSLLNSVFVERFIIILLSAWWLFFQQDVKLHWLIHWSLFCLPHDHNVIIIRWLTDATFIISRTQHIETRRLFWRFLSGYTLHKPKMTRLFWRDLWRGLW